jgi:hypothetical protein
LDVEGAPGWKGTTAEEVAAALPVDCTITCVAVMVVPLVVPRTRTGSPVLTALAEAERDPFVYFVEDVLLIVTF